MHLRIFYDLYKVHLFGERKITRIFIHLLNRFLFFLGAWAARPHVGSSYF